MCAHAREGGAAVNAEENAVEGVGASRLVRNLSSSPHGWIVFPSEEAYQIAYNQSRVDGDDELRDRIVNRSLLDWPCLRERLEKRGSRPLFRLKVVSSQEDQPLQTLLVGEDLCVLFDNLGKLLLSGVVAHCSVDVESVKIEGHV